jgi:hypothetical protein
MGAWLLQFLGPAPPFFASELWTGRCYLFFAGIKLCKAQSTKRPDHHPSPHDDGMLPCDRMAKSTVVRKIRVVLCASTFCRLAFAQVIRQAIASHTASVPQKRKRMAHHHHHHHPLPLLH